jgi:radical SAM protein with 4Fe4S-binding SPASM domain
MLQSASIAITQRCNLSCAHCADAVHRDRLSTSEELDRILFGKILAQLDRAGVRDLLISGGEPLLRNDLPELLDMVSRYHFYCGLYTNGTLLTPARTEAILDSGAVDFIRLSVEYPAGIDSKKQDMMHDTEQVLEKVRMLSDKDMTTGVNITLFPGTIGYVSELAESVKKAGGTFVRMVPVLPVDNVDCTNVTYDFIAQCIGTVLTLHKKDAENSAVEDRKSIWSAGKRFLSPCGGGEQFVAIATDGSMHICPMFDAETELISLKSLTLNDGLERLRIQKKRLVKRIRSGSDECGSCGEQGTCLGGCPAEWYSRANDGGAAPFCFTKVWEDALKNITVDASLKNVVGNMVDDYKHVTVFGKQPGCYRSLPFWSIRLR